MPDGFDDAQLEALLYPPPPAVAAEQRPVPDWAVVHRELRRPNVTLSLLWEEYRGGTGAQDGFGYSWFCDLYREWVGRLKPTLRQVHTAGERVFVDFAGHTMEVIDGATGEVRRAEIFVAVLGASSYTFAEASWTQSLPDWIAVHVNMLAFIGGVRGRSSATICAPASPGPASTSRWSTGPMPTWRRTTAPRSSRRGRTSRATRPRSRSAFRWSSAGSWRGCATAGSSRWPNSNTRSASWSIGLNAAPMRGGGTPDARSTSDRATRPAGAAADAV